MKENQYYQLYSAIKESGYSNNPESDPIKQISNGSFEISLDTVPVYEKADTEELIFRAVKMFSPIGSSLYSLGYFFSRESRGDVNQLDEAVEKVKKDGISFPMTNEEDENFYSMILTLKPLTYTQRIKYCEKDPIYLEALWQKAFSGKSGSVEAKEILDKELKNVPTKGLIITIGIFNMEALKLFNLISKLSIFSYILSQVLDSVSLSIFINGVKLWINKDVDKVSSPSKSYFITLEKEFYEKLEYLKNGDISFTEFLNSLKTENITLWQK